MSQEQIRTLTAGFVGLGNMGWPMAANLVAAGLALVVYDADAERQAAFLASHAGRAGDDPGAFAAAQIVITMLPDDRAVARALIDGGIAAALPSGAVVVDMSSSDPFGTRALAERLPRGLSLVDAPVSGGVVRARSGELSIMCGSDSPEAIERARPVLEILGDRVVATGPLGSAHALKVLNNYLAAAAYVAASEAVLVGTHFGLDPEVFLEVVNTSTGRSFMSEVVFPGDVLTGEYATGFALGLLAKDVRIARELAQALDVDAPALRLVSHRWAEAADGLGAAADHSEAHKKWWPDESGRFAAGSRES